MKWTQNARLEVLTFDCVIEHKVMDMIALQVQHTVWLR